MPLVCARAHHPFHALLSFNCASTVRPRRWHGRTDRHTVLDAPLPLGGGLEEDLELVQGMHMVWVPDLPRSDLRELEGMGTSVDCCI